MCLFVSSLTPCASSIMSPESYERCIRTSFRFSMRDVVTFLFAFIAFPQGISDAAWTLTSSPHPIIAGESFTLTCKPDNNINSIYWKRRNSMSTFDQYVAYTTRSSNNTCVVAANSDNRYQYSCNAGPLFQLTVPVNESSFVKQHRIYWRCDSQSGSNGISAGYNTFIYEPVRTVRILDPKIMYKNVTEELRCTTSYCYPVANVSLTTTADAVGSVLQGSNTEASGLASSYAIQSIKPTGHTKEEYVYCSAVNIPGREHVRETLIITVHYAPTVDPLIFGYTNRSDIYESEEVILNCQQPGGNPLSNVSWECFGAPETINSTENISSSNVKIRIDRAMDNRTCVCSVEHPDKTVSYNKTITIYFNVHYMDLSLKSGTIVVSNTEDILLECTAIGRPSTYTFHPWAHMIGTKVIRTLPGLPNRNNITLELLFTSFQDSGTYVCFGDNSNGKHVMSKQIEVTVNDAPVVTDSGGNNFNKIYVDFYSIPKPQQIEWIKDGKTIFISENYQQTMSIVDVNITIHGVKVVTNGYRTQLLVKKPIDIDYGKYLVVIRNQNGKTEHEVIYETNPSEKTVSNTGAAVGAGIGSVIALIMIIGGIFLFRRYKTGTTVYKSNKDINNMHMGDSNRRPYENVGKETEDNVYAVTTLDETHENTGDSGMNTQNHETSSSNDLQPYEEINLQDRPTTSATNRNARCII